MAAKTYLKAKLAIYLLLLVPVISGTADFTYTQAAIEDTDNDGTADISAGAELFDIPVSYSVGYCPHENGTYGLATGDVDNDGLIDVVVANNHENNMGVFIQDNNGNLKQMERYATGTGSRSAAVGDINNDGLNDIVILNYWSDDISVFLQTEDGRIGEPVNYDAGYGPYRVTIGDVSNDDLPDVVVMVQANGGLSHIHIYKQNNTGLLDPNISYEAGNCGSGLAVGDINNDGLNDIVTSAGRSMYVFLQESDGGFERIEYPVYDYYPEYDDYDAEIENIAIGDVNNDNLNDIVTCSYDQMSIYYQNQGGGLDDPVGYPRCRDAAIGDINNDKLNDIVSVKWGISNGGNIRVFLQQNNSQFHQMEYTFGLSLRNVEINDLNNDGLNDVAVVDDNTNELGVLLQLRTGITYHVNGVSGNNTNDGLTTQTAFETIQRGINVAEDRDTVLVWPGVYNDEIAFWGDAITVKSAADAAVIETDYGYAFSFFSAEGPGTVLSNFIIRNSQFGIYLVNGASPTIRNLTIVNNDFGISAFNGADPDIRSCIFWGNNYGDLFRDPVPLEAKYSFVPEVVSEPIAHWKFDDGSGSTATDSAGTNNGTLIGDPTWTAGQIGGALSFDGDGDYVEFTSIAALQGDNLTAQAWVCVDESAGLWTPVIMQHDLYSNGYYLYIINNRPSFQIIEGSSFAQAASVEELNPDQWYHIAATNDGSILKMYVDGRLKGSGASAGMTGVNYDAYIGCDPVSPLYYIGLIDDVRIYDRALSAGEIEAIYEAGLAGISYGGPGFIDAGSGDYHLLSERGRYWPAHDVWVLDDVTSPCIDGGDPAIDPSNERMPNGGRINMGAYGNTAYASMSEWPIKGDTNHDGRFNFVDVAILLDQWLAELPWAQ